jgi:adenosylcobinamide-GDP ribazoletransferase
MLAVAYGLPPAGNEDGQGARMAKKTSTTSLVVGTACTVVIVSAACGLAAVLMIVVASAVAALTGVYYRRRIGGITGDCLGATCQVTECAVCLAGVIS